MNKHLEPVFEVLLPGLEKAEVEYWVYGGVSIAAFAGRFIRENKDVDIFVKEADFENTKSVLDDLCNRYGFKPKPCKPLRNQRPKLEVIDKSEILSVVPVYLKERVVEFRFKNGTAEYPYPILERVERHISSYHFFTPPDEYVKTLFIKYLTLRPNVKNRRNTRKDAETILTPDEIGQLYPSGG